MFSTRRYPIDTPEYYPITKGAKLIRRAAFIWFALGIFLLIAAAIFVWVGYTIATGKQIRGLPEFHQDQGAGIGGMWMPLALGAFACFSWATLLRMFAALSLAIRDMARNSFLIPEPPRAPSSPTE